METDATFMDCPAYLDGRRQARCGLPAEVEARWTMGSTDGPLQSVKIRCPQGHWFSGPVEALTWDECRQPGGTASTISSESSSGSK
jgi:hypothetical protein